MASVYTNVLTYVMTPCHHSPMNLIPAPVHTCGNCQRYTAVVDGWAMDFAVDGFTPTDVRHSCGESDRRR